MMVANRDHPGLERPFQDFVSLMISQCVVACETWPTLQVDAYGRSTSNEFTICPLSWVYWVQNVNLRPYHAMPLCQPWE